ncbi:MAG TPA: PGPGW domain-containing protein [Acidobacteriota bacterium]
MLTIAFRVGALIVGTSLVLVGIVGIFVPILQGFLLIALGLSVLSMASERVAAFVERQKAWAKSVWERRRGQHG